MELLCGAIAGRRLLRFAYGGGLRTVEPHAHGFSRAGVELLRAYQVFGFSASGEGPGWRTFHVERITGARAADETFAPRPDFRSDDCGVSQLHCAV